MTAQLSGNADVPSDAPALAAATDMRQRHSSPVPLVAAVLFLVVFLVANLQVISDWLRYSFDDGTYSHAYLIPVMSLYLLYTGWKRGALVLRGSWGFCLALAASLLLFEWMDLAHQRFFARALTPLCMISGLLAILRPNRFVVGAAAMFWFVTPVWGPVNEFLQWSSVHAVATIMSYTGIPTFVYAEYVQIPAGTFEIADGCSGLRYVIATLALVTFYSVLYLQNYRSMLIFTVVAVFGSMLTNWLRIVALILIGHFSDMQNSLVQDHNMFGWFLFFPLMLLVFRFADRLERPADPALAKAVDQSSMPASAGEGTTGAQDPPANAVAILAAALLLLVFSGMTLRLLEGRPALALIEELDVTVAEPIAMTLQPAPKIYAADAVVVQSLANVPTGFVYEISFSGEIDAQRSEFYLNEMVPEGWRVVDERETAEVGELLLQKDGELALLQYAYGVGSEHFGSRAALRLPRLRAALQLDRRSTLIWGFIACADDCDSTEREQLAAAVDEAGALDSGL